MASSIVENWYQALLDEDCLRIMKLLKEDPRLLMKGWKSGIAEDDSSSIRKLLEKDPRLLTKWSKSGISGEHSSSIGKLLEEDPRFLTKWWKGRSVFHVAARRGCVELIVRALKVCRFEDKRDNTDAEENRSQKCREFFDRALERYNFEKMLISFPMMDNHGFSGSWSLPPANEEEQGEGTNPLSSTRFGQEHGARTRSLSRDHGGSDESAVASSSSLNVMGTTAPPAGSSDQADTEEADEKGKTVVGSFDPPSDGEQQTMPRVQSVEAPVVPSGSPKPPLEVKFAEGSGGNQGPPVSLDLRESDLRDILFAKDGWYKMDALAMGTICGNKNLIDLLSGAMLTCRPTGNYDDNDNIWIDGSPRYQYWRDLYFKSSNEGEEMKSIRDITKQILSKLVHERLIDLLKRYSEQPDFNFLHPYEYLFHFSYTTLGKGFSNWKDFCPYLDSERKRPCLGFLMLLQDGQGRPPVHVAADEQNFKDFKTDLKYHSRSVTIWPEAEVAKDERFRTVYARLYSRRTEQDFTLEERELEGWKDAVHKTGAISAELRNDHRTISIENRNKWVFDTARLSQKNGFRDGMYQSDSLCATIIRKAEKMSFLLADVKLREKPVYSPVGVRKREMAKESPYIIPKSYNEYGGKQQLVVEQPVWAADNPDLPEWATANPGTKHQRDMTMQKLSYLHLACIVDNCTLLKHLISVGYLEKFQSAKDYYPGKCHILHHIAASGNYKMLKMFMDVSKCDPFIEDRDGNNALHYALGEPVVTHFKWHLLDYISCQEVLDNDDREQEEKRDILENVALVKRKGCVNLLLQYGCDVFKLNKSGEPPYPQGCLADKEEFLEWWYKIQASEFKMIQRNLTSAASAIAITATLVATASHVGPSTPLPGYDNNQDIQHQVQHQNFWVATFVFCDTVSFYLAIAAIIFSLIPTLPVTQQAMIEELRRTRRMVIWGIGALFLSITFVFVAFVSSSIAMISASIGVKLIIATMCIGAPSIIVAILVFFIRLLGIRFPRATLIRRLYKLSL